MGHRLSQHDAFNPVEYPTGSCRNAMRSSFPRVGSALQGIEDERRAQEIAAQTLEAPTATAVDGEGGVQLHAAFADQ